MIKAISFDVGDTLLRPYPSFGEAAVGCCDEAGLTLPSGAARRLEQLADAHFAERRARGLAYSTAPELSKAAWLELYRDFLRREGVPEAEVDTVAERVYQRFLQPSTYRLFDDALPAVRACRARGLKVGILSNWEDWLPTLLAHAQLDRLLDFAVISGVVGHEKPDRRIFEATIAAAGVRPEELAHVGDSLASDAAGARAVGVRAILLDRLGRYPTADFERIASLSELPGLL